MIFASALKVYPSSLSVELSNGEGIAELTVNNPSQEATLYEVFSEEFDWIKADPANFVLNGGENQTVSLRIRQSDPGIFASAISVTASNLSERKFQAKAGVKIPLEIRISAGNSQKLLASLSVLLGRVISSESFKASAMILGALIVFFLGIWAGKKKLFTKQP